MQQKQWTSKIPENCEVCNKPLSMYFIDGAVRIHGPWALMCEECWKKTGLSFGIGRGQKYLKSTGKGVEGFDEI